MSAKIIVENIRIPTDFDDAEIISKARKQLKKCGISFENDSLRIYKKSIDARRKDNITFVSSVSAVTNEAESKVVKNGFKYFEEEMLSFSRGHEKMDGRPYVIGFGPAGIFCALLLAEHGLAPVVIERGSDVENRVRAVDNFYKNGVLDTETNIQFGAGGAGTFSDGKLVTRIGDRRTTYVLEKLHMLGAPEDILYKAKPHVGTDVLRNVVKNAATELLRLGGDIRYNTKAERIADGKILINGEWEKCGCCILAPGHSSRDTYSSLLDDCFVVEPKPFSVGVRVEHLQKDIDRSMYGDEALAERLGHAEYKLSYRNGDRGVYSFCMCPGGEVVAAASEEGGVVTNGMSSRARNLDNANAAIAVSVLPQDFNNNVRDAIAFQRELEKKAFKAGGRNYSAPCQSIGNFYAGKDGGFGERITPSYMSGNVSSADFNKILPDFTVEMLKSGFAVFGKKIKGFNDSCVPMTGVETRTSAPVRIVRDDNYVALGHDLIYPCGEGAGYAGGITSAAVDGLRVAQAILERFN